MGVDRPEFVQQIRSARGSSLRLRHDRMAAARIVGLLLSSPSSTVAHDLVLFHSQETATQAAAHFLKRRVRRMSHLKLLRLLCLDYRRTLLDHRRPIAFDGYAAADPGPVLSRSCNRLVFDKAPVTQSY